MLSRLAAATEGFAGADLQALCSAAVLAAARRTAPGLTDTLTQPAPADSPLAAVRVSSAPHQRPLKSSNHP